MGELTPGRVQVDVMKGTFDEATAYLTQGLSKKEKKFGEVKDDKPLEGTCSLCNRVHHRIFLRSYTDATLCLDCHLEWKTYNEECPEDKLTSAQFVELFRSFRQIISLCNVSKDALGSPQEASHEKA